MKLVDLWCIVMYSNIIILYLIKRRICRAKVVRCRGLIPYISKKVDNVCSFVTYRGKEMPENYSCQFKLCVSNLFGYQGCSVSSLVQRKSSELPSIDLGASKRRIKAAQEFKLSRKWHLYKLKAQRILKDSIYSAAEAPA